MPSHHFSKAVRRNDVGAKKCQMNRLRTDPCVWIKKDSQTGKTTGYLASHVDDLLVAGQWSHPEWIQTVETFKQAFLWSPWEEQSFALCGISLEQHADFSFSFSHHTYVEQINQITVNDSEPGITADEMSQARAVLGAIQWRAIQSGPQHTAKLSWLQSALCGGAKDVLHQTNKLCRECHAQRFQSIAIKNLGAQRDEDISFACWTDAAVGNRPDMSSTGGYMITTVDSSFLRGQEVRLPEKWKAGESCQILSQCREELMYVRAEWAELPGHTLDLCRPELTASKIHAAVIIDAKECL